MGSLPHHEQAQKQHLDIPNPKSMKSMGKLSNSLVILIISLMCFQPNIFHFALTTMLSYSHSRRKMKKTRNLLKEHSSLKQDINKKNHKSKTKSLVSLVQKPILIFSCHAKDTL
jgi:hypothetical protein